LGPDKTLVRLTTRYRMRTSFPAYLSWWGERLLGDIQSNVLAIVMQRAERASVMTARDRTMLANERRAG
jgi:hypothetical protein